MPAGENELLTTGQAAKFCSVTPDTILKWIKKGRLKGVRTAGGHYRVQRQDLQPHMVTPGPTAQPQGCPQNLHCWQYLSDRGVVRDSCRECVVYRTRAAQCFGMAGLEADRGHRRRLCQTSCHDCVYYRRVNGLPTNVMVITPDDELIERLSDEEDKSVILRFARNGYEASAIIHDFRPAFVAIDVERIPIDDIGLLDSLSNDPRIPGLKVILAAPPGATRQERPKLDNDLVVGALEKPFGTRRIAKVINDSPTKPLPRPSGCF